MKRVLVVAGAVVVMLTGAVTPAHATTATYSTSSPLDVELRVIDEPTSVSLDQAPPSPNHDRAPRTSMKAATPPSTGGNGTTAPGSAAPNCVVTAPSRSDRAVGSRHVR